MENQNEILEIDNLKRVAKECFWDLNIDKDSIEIFYNQMIQ